MRAVSWFLLVLLVGCPACPRDEVRSAPDSRPPASRDASAPHASAPSSAHPAAPEDSGAGPSPLGSQAPPPDRPIGPFEIPFAGKRTVYFVAPRARAKPQRLMAMLHGVCNPPGYACGYWVHAASERGFLVCPTGDGSCGPGMYNAPTWNGSPATMDEDLENAIAAVEAQYPGEVSREGAILAGFSRGAFAAPAIAARSPGRWPYLILNEANVSLSVPALRKAGVRKVALIAGERGGERWGEAQTAKVLVAQGLPARLWLMPGAGHHYSADIDAIMAEAIDWLVSPEESSPASDAGRAR